MGKREDKLDKETREALTNLKDISQPPEFWKQYQEELFQRISRARTQDLPAGRRGARRRTQDALWPGLVYLRGAAVFLIGLAVGYLVIVMQPHQIDEPRVSEGQAPVVRENLTPAKGFDYKPLGVKFQPVSEALRSHLDLPPDKGVVISECFKNSLAQKIGFKPGDIILEINDQPILPYYQPDGTVSLPIPSAEHIRLKIIREGLTITIYPDELLSREFNELMRGSEKPRQ